MIEKFITGMLDAYDFRPSRAEPLADLAAHFREQGKNALACLFAEAAMAIEHSPDHLFVERPAYTWRPRRDFSICAFYDHRRRSKGYEVTDRLITDATAPDWVRAEARRNMFFYLQPLAHFCKSFATTPIAWKPPKEKYACANPSVVCFRDHLLLCMRTVNYRIREDGSYDMQGDDAIRTENYLLSLDENHAVTGAMDIVWSRPHPAFDLVLGLEDIRLFVDDEHLMCLACTREQNPEGMAEQVLGRIDEDTGNIIGWRTVRVEPRAHEKNWMPVQDFREPMRFVYRPDRIVNQHGETVAAFDGMAGINHFSGGTPLIEFNGGFLALVHESAIRPGALPKRFYQHRFVWFDTDYELSKWTLPFCFNDKTIEFAAGLARDPRNGNLLISYGVDDAAAFLATVDPMEVGYMLWRL